MRQPVIDGFPEAPWSPSRKRECVLEKRVNDVYVTDAYHSLSIEGYQVTPELDRAGSHRLLEPRKKRHPTASSGTRWRLAGTGSHSNQYSER